MRRASSRLLCHLRQPTTKTSSYILFRDSTTHYSCLAPTATTNDQSSNHESHTLNSCPKTQSLLFSSPKTYKFQTASSQNLNTLVDPNGQNVSLLSSRQRKIKERSQTEEDFESAESADDMLEAFKDMEASFDERNLGLACLKMGLKLD
ncbi:Hypothetical predicted protein [Olea europaea subsp. europaea]|uniref:Uncharacterized protein n=1 Tax=Olea europaea subsp. europaea TaxID=158383 RepID=A0A8S0PZ48_OLEEU|nr:Hypothetical predicted protein [Olea europaea subsp. europaea]